MLFADLLNFNKDLNIFLFDYNAEGWQLETSKNVKTALISTKESYLRRDSLQKIGFLKKACKLNTHILDDMIVAIFKQLDIKKEHGKFVVGDKMEGKDVVLDGANPEHVKIIINNLNPDPNHPKVEFNFSKAWKFKKESKQTKTVEKILLVEKEEKYFIITVNFKLNTEKTEPNYIKFALKNLGEFIVGCKDNNPENMVYFLENVKVQTEDLQEKINLTTLTQENLNEMYKSSKQSLQHVKRSKWVLFGTIIGIILGVSSMICFVCLLQCYIIYKMEMIRYRKISRQIENS